LEIHSTPRVLFVVPSLSRHAGGVTSAAVGLAASLQQLGIDVEIHATDAATPPQAKTTRRGLSVADRPDELLDLKTVLHPLIRPYRLAFSPRMMAALNQRVHQFDLVHIHGLFLFPQLAAFLAARRHKVPYIVSTHGMLHPHFQRHGLLRKRIVEGLWQRRMLSQAAALHATSAREKTAVDSFHYGPSVRVIANGFSLPEGTKGDGDQFRNQHGIALDRPVVMFHGRIAAVKGLDILIDAFAIVRGQYRNALLVIIGPDDENLIPELRQRAQRHEMVDSVMFLGPLHGSELMNAIQAADVWSLLSHSENFGLSVLEAMANGRAVVASRHADIVTEAESSGALIGVDTDVHQASEAIGGLLCSRSHNAALGALAKQYSEKFEWTGIAREFADLYLDVGRQHKPDRQSEVKNE
jgi:glycosyltransferase involved in cell wall biosynthesis